MYVLAIVHKCVAVLHHLYGDGFATYDAEREVTFLVCLHGLARSTVQHIVVDQEVGTLHGNARAVVGHVAREALAIDDGELAHRHVIGLVIEGDGIRIHLCLDTAAGSHLVSDVRQSLIGQFVGYVVSALVRHNGSLDASSCNVHRDVGDTSAVVEAHVTLHTTRILTGTACRQGLAGGVMTLAVGYRTYLIFIGLQWRHRLVLVGHLVQVSGNLHPGGVGDAHLAALHREVVYGVAVGVPCQHHAALTRLGQQLRLYLASARMIEEVFQVRVVDDGVAHIGRLCRRGHHGVTNLRPGSKVNQCGIALAIGRLGQRLRLGHCLAVDNLPVVLAQCLD